MTGTIISLNISKEKGVSKTPVDSCVLEVGRGVAGDAHSSPGDRQVSLLAGERIEEQQRGLRPGDFAENITTSGIDLREVRLGDLVTVGCAELVISKIGKECHSRCKIFDEIGDCIMPREGVFAEVKVGGLIRVGDAITIKSLACRAE